MGDRILRARRSANVCDFGSLMTFWTHKRTLFGNQIGSILPSLRAFTGGPVDNLGLTISTFFNLPTLYRSDLAKKNIYDKDFDPGGRKF